MEVVACGGGHRPHGVRFDLSFPQNQDEAYRAERLRAMGWVFVPGARRFDPAPGWFCPQHLPAEAQNEKRSHV